MKLHLLQKLFSLIACVYLASSGQCQEKARGIILTAEQKKTTDGSEKPLPEGV